jgi:hypothetical protein
LTFPHPGLYWIYGNKDDDDDDDDLLSMDSNDTNLIGYYKEYCKILANVIKDAKRLVYNNQVINSANKIKTIWNIIKTETNRSKGHMSNKYQNSPEAYNKHFLLGAGKIIQGNKYSNIKDPNNNIDPKYLSTSFWNSFP